MDDDTSTMTPEHLARFAEAEEGSARDYDEIQYWGDARLIETYRRLSRDLRHRGFDEETVHRMGVIETALRARGLDPDEIAREVDEELRDPDRT